MSADYLRETARMMRESVKSATPGPWKAVEQLHGEWFGIQSEWTALGTAFERSEAEHFASWNPTVALAVADWLDECADIMAAETMHALKAALSAHALIVAKAWRGDA